MTMKTSACCATASDPPYASPHFSGSRVCCSGAMACSAFAAIVVAWLCLLDGVALNSSDVLKENKEVAKGDETNKFELKEDPAAPATGEKHKYQTGPHKFSPAQWAMGNINFVSKADLSGCLNDGCLVIKCTVQVPRLMDDLQKGDPRLMDDLQKGDNNQSVIVPPAELSKDLANLLDSGLKADLTVKIGWFKRFKVHACVLAARSPVFRAQLCGAMMESTESSIRIEDVDAKVFEILLHYMYNDRLPESMDETTEETTNMAQYLLVAADRYAMERLKLICESRLSKALDMNTVGFTLDLAEQYHCQQLKDCCLRYMTRNGNRLQEIINNEGFAQLKRNHPQVAFDILGQVIALLAT